MNRLKLKIAAVIILLLATATLARLNEASDSHIIVEINSSDEEDFLVFVGKMDEIKRIENFKYRHFYVINPKFSLFDCLECKRNNISETIAAWANSRSFVNELYDVGPVNFHEGTPVSLLKQKSRQSTEPIITHSK